MIHRSSSIWHTSDWQSALKSMIRSLDELLEAVDLPLTSLDASIQAAKDFPLKVPRNYVAQIEKGNPLDPLLLQVLPQAAEMLEQVGFVEDPLDEARYNKAPGLVHKYAGRVLLIANPSCAIHCRYCFRRHFPYEDNTPGSNGWHEALTYIAADSSIHEVILSGGDPLSSNDAQLSLLIKRIEAIEHVQTLRIHTRLPVVIPERITDDFLDILLSTRLKPVMVLHINHANELSYDVCHAIQLLQQAGVRLFNQAVLLKGVNDTLASQRQLLQALYTLDVQAYYLHQLDNVKGAQHFAVSDIDAVRLLDALKATLPGYMLPKLVREIPAHSNKTALHF